MSQERKPENAGGGLLSGRPALPILGGLAAVVVVGIILVVVALGGGGGDEADADLHAGLADGDDPTPVATIDLNRATVVPSTNPNLTSLSAGDKLSIPKIGVDAPLSYKVVGLDGAPPDPDGADDVAYYDFSSWPGVGGAPGKGGNTVLAGHVDSGRKACKNGTVSPPCQAVFWDLGKLALGDEIKVTISGTVHTYKVTAQDSVDAVTADWSKIYATTAQETLTLITCAGSFSAGEYNKRVIVTAARV